MDTRKVILLSFEKTKPRGDRVTCKNELVMFHRDGHDYNLLANCKMESYCHVSEYINTIHEIIKGQGWERRDIVFTNCIPSRSGLNSYELDRIDCMELLYKGIVEGFFAVSPL